MNLCGTKILKICQIIVSSSPASVNVFISDLFKTQNEFRHNLGFLVATCACSPSNVRVSGPRMPNKIREILTVLCAHDPRNGPREIELFEFVE